MKLENSFNLDSKRFQIRQLTEDLVTSEYLAWFEDEAVKKFIINIPSSLEELKSYAKEHHLKCDSLLLGIYKDNHHVANIKFEPISLDKKHAVFGIIIGNPKARGIGLLGEVLPIINKELKSRFQTKTIYLGVEPDNIAAIKSYEKNGFVQLTDDTKSPLKLSNGLVMELLI